MDCYQTKLDLETGYRKLDERLRNPSQLRTIGDGDCGPRSVLDQLMNGRTKVNFKDDDFLGVKCWVVRMMELQIMAGQIHWPYDDEQAMSYENWAERMKRKGEFVDNIWFQGLAKATGSDVIIIPTHAESADFKSLFTWIRGGPTLNNKDT